MLRALLEKVNRYARTGGKYKQKDGKSKKESKTNDRDQDTVSH